MNTLVKVQFFIALVVSVNSASLPDYYTICKKGSPDLSECLLKNANTAIERLGKDNGDSKLKVNGLNPIKIEFIDLQATPNLKVVLNNADFYGFNNLKISEVSFTDNELKISSRSDMLQIISEYDIKGRILILPIQGVGRINVTTIDTAVIYTAKLGSVEKNGVKHYTIEKELTKFKPEKIYYQLDNLFNGDKRLGDEMNKFLNEQWKDVFEEVEEAWSSTVGSIFTKYISIYLDKLSAEQLLAD